ncbi:MAG: pyruvate kinase [Candidatus Krumholzibacteria bacterium]|nr:pyruvate kinase [Candidatus Krumholzibacteria bacterium]
MERRAKIICTIGPACGGAMKLRQLLDAGMNVARLNFSHGFPAEHKAVFDRLKKLDGGVAIMQDLAGPKIRIGEIEGGQARLREGGAFVLTTKNVAGDEEGAHVDYRFRPGDVKTGDDLYLADGSIHLKVERVGGREIRCRIVHGGVVTSRKGLNVPRLRIRQSLSAKDERDLEFGLAMGVDYVAVSFVTCAADVRRVKRIIRERKSPALVVAKIEKERALARLDGIVEAADAIMIARGDLGVEIPLERVPVVQKEIIARCREMGKPVIVATQMLESMVGSERPTRAEASDVANAAFDGADALMLSAETATGAFSVESVGVMDRIVREAERYGRRPARNECGAGAPWPPRDLAETACEAAARTAASSGARAIACLTRTGRTARLIARYRPAATRIFALTDDRGVMRQMNLVWGTEAIHIGRIDRTDAIFPLVKERLRAAGVRGLVVLAAGIPVREKGSTNAVYLVNC